MLLVANRYCHFAGTSLHSNTPSCGSGRWKRWSFTVVMASVVARSSHVARMRLCRRLLLLKISCSRCSVETHRRPSETSRDSQLLSTATVTTVGWYPSVTWQGCPFIIKCEYVLALERDDIPVVFVDLSVCVRSPQALYLPCCLLFGIDVLWLFHFYVFLCCLLLEFYFVNLCWVDKV